MMIRAFIAIEIPLLGDFPDLLERLRRSGARISVPKAGTMHVTLKFLGDVREEMVPKVIDLMKSAINDLKQFEVAIGATGAFPSMHSPRVLWVGLREGGRMGEIAGRIDKGLSGLGFEREKRAFTPHVTVARVKDVHGIEKAVSVIREYEKVQFGSFIVKEIRLKKSTLTPTGSIYEDLAILPLSQI